MVEPGLGEQRDGDDRRRAQITRSRRPTGLQQITLFAAQVLDGLWKSNLGDCSVHGFRGPDTTRRVGKHVYDFSRRGVGPEELVFWGVTSHEASLLPSVKLSLSPPAMDDWVDIFLKQAALRVVMYVEFAQKTPGRWIALTMWTRTVADRSRMLAIARFVTERGRRTLEGRRAATVVLQENSTLDCRQGRGAIQQPTAADAHGGGLFIIAVPTPYLQSLARRALDGLHSAGAALRTCVGTRL